MNSTKWYRENKDRALAYQKSRNTRQRPERLLTAFNYLGGPICADCGYDEDIRALQFDHIPERGEKRATIAGRLFSSQAWLEEELDKCEVVCANCHCLRTANRKET